MDGNPPDAAAISGADDGFVAWLAALTENTNPPAQDGSGMGSSPPLPAVTLDTLLLPPAAFAAQSEPSEQPPLAATQAGGATMYPDGQMQYHAGAPMPQQMGPMQQQQQQYQPQQTRQQAQQQATYPGPQYPQQLPQYGAQQIAATAAQPWHMQGLQQGMQQSPPQQLQQYHLPAASGLRQLRSAGSGEQVTAGLAPRGGLAAAAAAAAAARANSGGSGGSVGSGELAAIQPGVSAAVPMAGMPASAGQSPAANAAGNAAPDASADVDPAIAKALRKQRLLQEKNRRAQARFRERQKSKATEQQEQIAELGRRVAALEVERAELASKNAMLQKVAAIRSDARAGGETECAEDDAVVAGQLAGMLNLVRPGDSAWRPDITAADVAAMSVEEITGRFKDGIQEIGVLLLAGGDDAASPAGQRLAAIMAANQQLTISYCTKRTRRLRTLEMSIFNSQAQQHGRPTPDHWRKVMEAIRLTEDQRVALRRARRDLLAGMSQLMTQRREVISLLLAGMPSATDDIHNAIGYDKASQASRQLRQNLEEEGHQVTQFLVALDQTVSPLQQARWMVESYPWMPDMLSLCNVLAEDAGEGACAEMEADTATWMTGLDGSHSGAGLLPPGSAFRMLAQGATSAPMQGMSTALLSQPQTPPAAP